MTLTVKLFAAMRDLAGSDTVEVELPADATVGDLRREVAKQIPLARTLLLRSNIAVNHEAADNERPIQATDEVAVIPPVSGG
ncbi:molybdopterin converting factor : ThiamineS protein OS=Planctomyces brasiliensis (strain ATCC 49424 / DSM 5305 / JCM 21570 / NBRC 103401 / IFAM 1448) GN=Plabr_3958 PE=4 SV=1: ThiS [Gemmata massiliana]|uniref:Molybdopterin synthase sulfur carrier subunit n=1 Tax=Gemmata massiliana TaxID=1210884 RepID=A0A6P2CSN7_9BACT|nr:molybdopterin converting factor subunit 1 [Gemmata massiliana]VTR90734.1 molybdopterin converting factor : ThiamineS protein OS=Planctomyces brasiliensis (strain ATCC 49424 / DSM 5305 / JCM 21570 / NBRC 103401 / IFAM 1448) GN=Plabr_3958 PE=4 SV=1: ThiS [Gemmata massiliana]